MKRRTSARHVARLSDETDTPRTAQHSLSKVTQRQAAQNRIYYVESLNKKKKT